MLYLPNDEAHESLQQLANGIANFGSVLTRAEMLDNEELADVIEDEMMTLQVLGRHVAAQLRNARRS